MASPNVAAVIRQEQKDAFYVDWLRSRSSELALHVAGARLWAQLQAEQRLAADLAYYALTTACGLQTLGEEYVGLVQASAASVGGDGAGDRPSPQRRLAPVLRAPGLARRLVAVALRALAPYCGGKLLALWRRRIGALDDPRKDRLLDALELLCEMALVTGRLHQMLFLIEGAYCALSSRLAGVRYVTARRRPAPDEVSATSAEARLRLLGCLGVAQSAFLLVQGAVRLYRCLSSPPPTAGEQLSGGPPPTVHFLQENAVTAMRRSKCCICLEPVKDATASPCGHLFCWSCIHSGCKAAARPECPVCREPLATSRLVYLQNY